MTIPLSIQGAWFGGAALFIFGLKGMSSPASARKGIVIAGYGMLLAIAGTFLIPDLQNLGLMALALVVGGGLAWVSGQKVKMTDMPQMVAIYNGMGGGAAAAIAAALSLLLAAIGCNVAWGIIDGVLYVKVVDPRAASYGVSDAAFAVVQLAQTTMRSELGKITLDKTFEERTNINQAVVTELDKAYSIAVAELEMTRASLDRMTHERDFYQRFTVEMVTQLNNAVSNRLPRSCRSWLANDGKLGWRSVD